MRTIALRIEAEKAARHRPGIREAQAAVMALHHREPQTGVWLIVRRFRQRAPAGSATEQTIRLLPGHSGRRRVLERGFILMRNSGMVDHPDLTSGVIQLRDYSRPARSGQLLLVLKLPFGQAAFRFSQGWQNGPLFDNS